MLRSVCIAATALTLTACASVETPLDDGYQFGDIGATRAQYCENASAVQRAVLYGIATSAGLSLPPGGACTDVLQVLEDADINTPADTQ